MKKIAFITTARSEYNASRWVIKAINDDPELELHLLVGGTHLYPEFTSEEIKKDGYDFSTIGTYVAHDYKLLIHCLEKMMGKMGYELRHNNYDLLIINGDRIELMPIVLAASIHGIPIAHIGGGDITEGSLDNETRYAISRYAHLHFVSDKQSADNLFKTGEENWRIHVVGQCGLENIIRTDKLSLEDTSKAIGLDLSVTTAVCIYYPSRELNISVQEQISCILDSLHDTDTQTVFIYPCSEIGSDIIRTEIDEYCKNHDNCKAFSNIENQLFQSLLWNCSFMIGNSSAGMIESPFINKYSINVGNRQNGRYVNDTVFMCDYAEYQITDAINYCIDNPLKSLNIEYMELPSQKIINAIKESIDNPQLLHKKILL